MKCCYRCRQTLVLSEFYKDRSKKDGYVNACKNCSKEMRRIRYRRDIKLALWKQQNGVCPICGVVLDSNELSKANLDHDHQCCSRGCENCYRGLLCPKCNRGLGYFQDSSEILIQASSYLLKTKRG